MNADTHIYSVPVGEKKPGETQAYRNPKYAQELINNIYPNVMVARDVLLNAVQKHPAKEFLGTRDEQTGKYVFRTYSETLQMANEIGSGLIHMKLPAYRSEYHDIKVNVIGIISENREEYALVDLACMNYNLCLATMFEGLLNIEQAFDLIGITTCVCSAAGVKRLLHNDKPIPTLQTIVCLDSIELDDTENAKELNIRLINFKEVWYEGKSHLLDPLTINVTPEMVCTFVFTSGTEGAPKAVMIQNAGFVTFLSQDCSTGNHDFQDFDTAVSLAPFNHIAERLLLLVHASHFSKYCFVNKDQAKWLADIQAAKPTILAVSPRFFNKIYQAMQDRICAQSKFKQFLINLGIRSKISNIYKHNRYSHQFWDRLVFQKFRDAVGGRVRTMVNFGAPLSPEIKDFLMAAFQSTITNYYSSTEILGTVLGTHINDKEGASFHCGGPFCSAEFKLVDEPGMNYLTDRKDPRLSPQGEICIRAKYTFAGYYKNEALTKEYLTEDGWYRMGDIGEVLPNGALKIIDRKRALVKLMSGGMFISPERAESIYQEVPIVSDIFVYGDGTRYFLIAIAFPSQLQLEKLAQLHGINGTFENLCDNQQLSQLILDQLRKHGKERGLFDYEQPQKLCLINQNFKSLDITNALQKIMRHKAKIVFKKQIDALYQN